jgi:hypothetical protein
VLGIVIVHPVSTAMAVPPTMNVSAAVVSPEFDTVGLANVPQAVGEAVTAPETNVADGIVNFIVVAVASANGALK